MNMRYWIGRIFPKLRHLRHLSTLAYLSDFIEEHPSPSLRDRVELYRYVNEFHLGTKPLCLIELGVWQGETISHWAHINADPQSRFYGIDTFEGLPEDWQHLFGKSVRGTFSTHGQVPVIEDIRISFIRGLIQEQLQELLARIELDNASLVVHFDADLYSATLFALTTLDIVLATRIARYVAVFDEFSSANDEFRAFVDYQSAFRRQFSVIAHVGKSHDQIAIQIELPERQILAE
jgi:O-methyltransferase